MLVMCLIFKYFIYIFLLYSYLKGFKAYNNYYIPLSIYI